MLKNWNSEFDNTIKHLFLNSAKLECLLFLLIIFG